MHTLSSAEPGRAAQMDLSFVPPGVLNKQTQTNKKKMLRT
jgi:hypothetical protein